MAPLYPGYSASRNVSRKKPRMSYGRGETAAPSALTDRQISLVALSKVPDVEGTLRAIEAVQSVDPQCKDDYETPDTVMAPVLQTLHDALPASEASLRNELIHRVGTKSEASGDDKADPRVVARLQKIKVERAERAERQRMPFQDRFLPSYTRPRRRPVRLGSDLPTRLEKALGAAIDLVREWSRRKPRPSAEAAPLRAEGAADGAEHKQVLKRSHTY